MFIAALFTIAKRWKQPKNPSRNEWINKIQYMHTMKYYSVLKRKEILTHTTTWMKPEDTILKEKTNTILFHLYDVPRRVKFIETKSRMVVARETGVDGYCLMGTEFQFFKIKRFLELNGVDGCTAM